MAGGLYPLDRIIRSVLGEHASCFAASRARLHEGTGDRKSPPSSVAGAAPTMTSQNAGESGVGKSGAGDGNRTHAISLGS